jgi:hypothetical protein
MTTRRVAWVLGLLCVTGCKLPTPYSPLQLAEDSQNRPAKALVHYLSQPPPLQLAVCDPHADGPHVARMDDKVVDALMKGLARGRIPAENWMGCVRAAWEGADPGLRAQIASAVLHGFVEALTAANPDAEEWVWYNLEAVATAMEARPPQAGLRVEEARSITSQVRTMQPDLGPRATPFADRFLQEVDLELGFWDGAPVDSARIATETDEELLLRFAQRLPEPTLREAARDRLVRLRVAASPFAAVRDRADAVTESTLARGFWPVPLETFPVATVRTATTLSGAAGVVVKQDLDEGRWSLRGITSDGRLLDAVIDLRDLLRMEVEGLEKPILLCQENDGLQPEPCVAPSALACEHPVADLDETGQLHLASGKIEEAPHPLAHAQTLEFALSVAETPQDLSLPLRFLPPPPVVHAGETGEPGPGLVVRVRRQGPDRFLYEVTAGDHTQRAILERSDLPEFRVVSQGGEGRPGTEGAEGERGAPGHDGSTAICPYTQAGDGGIGFDGGPGGPGGPGGSGGPGGDIELFVQWSRRSRRSRRQGRRRGPRRARGRGSDLPPLFGPALG